MSRATEWAEWLEGAKLCDDSAEWAKKLEESAAPLIARVAELEADAARWKAVRDHWKKANFTFRRDPANLLKSINLTVDFDHFTGGGASEIERELDAAIAAKD